MNQKREFEIAFVGLKPGIHEYQFEITDKFFESFQQQDFHNCQAIVKLTLDKRSGFLLLKFDIGGQIEVVCDRCSNDLPMQLWDEFHMTVKMVDDPEMMNKQEEDPDVYFISRTESHIHISEWIYEFINLSIPMQKTCNYENMDGPPCNKAALEILQKMKTDNGEIENPIWKDLQKFKDLDKE
jgi:uncharacterized metal-binding protein YceD (DUF177 family)